MIMFRETAQDKIAKHRTLVTNCKVVTNYIMPCLHSMTEYGRRMAAMSISELDVTSNFDNVEDKIISLFASLASEENNETFATLDMWREYCPRDLVSKRLFTEIHGNLGFNKTRFKRLMDILWQWAKDYYSVYDTFETLAHEQDPLSTLKWMLGEQIKMPDLDYRLARFVMALFTDDEGIGQGIMLYKHPENLTVPPCRIVTAVKKTFCEVENITKGECADIMGLQYETDLYYTALAWNDLRVRNKNRYACIQRLVRNMQAAGGRDRNAKDCIQRIFRDESEKVWNK